METGKGYVFRQLLLVLSVCVIGLAISSYSRYLSKQWEQASE